MKTNKELLRYFRSVGKDIEDILSSTAMHPKEIRFWESCDSTLTTISNSIDKFVNTVITETEELFSETATGNHKEEPLYDIHGEPLVEGALYCLLESLKDTQLWNEIAWFNYQEERIFKFDNRKIQILSSPKPNLVRYKDAKVIFAERTDNASPSLSMEKELFLYHTLMATQQEFARINGDHMNKLAQSTSTRLKKEDSTGTDIEKIRKQSEKVGKQLANDLFETVLSETRHQS